MFVQIRRQLLIISMLSLVATTSNLQGLLATIEPSVPVAAAADCTNLAELKAGLNFNIISGNSGFRVWNSTGCEIPVTAFAFTTVNGQQTLYSMQNKTISAATGEQAVVIGYPGACGQLDLSYGHTNPTLAVGTPIDTVNATVNWSVNALSGYAYGGNCPVATAPDCSVAAIKAAIAQNTLRFDRLAGDTGFKVWNDTGCNIPVTAFSFKTTNGQQTLNAMYNTNITSGTAQQSIAISRAPGSCGQMDLSFGHTTPAAVFGTPIESVNATVNWATNGLSGYVYGGDCPVAQAPDCSVTAIKAAVAQNRLRFDRLAGDTGFKVWNDTGCNIPVTAFSFKTTDGQQTLHTMYNTNIGSGTAQQSIAITRAPGTCGQMDLSFGHTTPALAFGTPVATVNAQLNWAQNGLSGYVYGGDCATPVNECANLNAALVKTWIQQERIRFDRTPANNGFKVWNNTSCAIPVTKAFFRINNGDMNNQTLLQAQFDTIQANAVSQSVTLPGSTESCGQFQNDLVFGHVVGLSVGQTIQQFNAITNFTETGMSAYQYGSQCASSSSSTSLCANLTGPLVQSWVANQTLRFDRLPNNRGFKVWNTTGCAIPVTKAAFNILDSLENQSLYHMSSDTIQLNANAQEIYLPAPNTACVWAQNDLVFGTHTTLPNGTSVQAFNNAVNWASNGISAYNYGGPCSTPAPTLTAQKIALQTSVVSGGGIARYKVRVTNTGTAPAQNVVVNDSFQGLGTGNSVFRSNLSSSVCSANGTNVQCVIGTVAAGATVEVDLAFEINNASFACQPSTIVNQATVSANGVNAFTVTASPVTVTCPVQGTPTLQIEKLRNQSFVTRGGIVSYTINVRNTGTAAATNVVVTDPVPFISNGTVTFRADLSNGCQLSSGTVTCVVGTVSPGQTVSYIVAFTVGNVADSCTPGSTATLVNSAYASGTGVSPVSVTAQGVTVQCPGSQNAILSIQKTVSPGVVTRGGTVKYTIIVRNNGNVNATNVNMLDIMGNLTGGNVTFIPNPSPANCYTPADVAAFNAAFGSTVNVQANYNAAFDFDNNGTVDSQDQAIFGNNVCNNVANTSTAGCFASGNNINCPVGTLTPGQQRVFELFFTIGSQTNSCTPGSSVQLTNTAYASATGLTTNSASAQLTVNCGTTSSSSSSVPSNTTLAIDKTTFQSSVQRGGLVGYTITVTNTGNATANNVIVTDVVPTIANGVVTFEQLSSSNFCTLVGNSVQCNLGTVAAGQTRTVAIAFRVGSVGDVCSSTPVSLNNTASVSANNAATTSDPAPSVTVNCTVVQGGLTVTKTDNRTTATPGDTLNYLIVVTNPSSTAVNNVTVVDTLSNLTTFVTASNGGTVSGQNVTWSNLSIAANSSISLALVAQVISSATNGSFVVNNVLVNGQFPNSDTTTVQTSGTQSVSITITDTPDPVEPCEEIDYRITVTNTSNQTISNLTVNQAYNSSDLEFEDANNNGFEQGNGVRWTNISLLAGESRVLTSTATVDCGADDGDILSSTATALNASASTTTRVDDDNDNDDDEDMSITATGDPDNVEPGDIIEYTIRVTNDSDDEQTVDVRAELDENTIFLDASGNGDEDGDDEVVWENIRFDEEETRTFKLEVRVRNSADDGDVLRMRASIPGDSDTVNTDVGEGDDDDDDIPSGNGSISVTKFADRFDANPGDEVTYTVTITNTSSRNLRNLSVIDSFPSSMLVLTEQGGGTPTASGIRWTIDLNAGQTRTLVYRSRITNNARPGDIIRNNVSVTGSDLPTPGSASADVRIISYLPQTGAQYTSRLENTKRFLSPFKTASEGTGVGGMAAAAVSTALASAGFILRRKFFI